MTTVGSSCDHQTAPRTSSHRVDGRAVAVDVESRGEEEEAAEDAHEAADVERALQADELLQRRPRVAAAPPQRVRDLPTHAAPSPTSASTHTPTSEIIAFIVPK